MGREPQVAAACCDLVADVARASGSVQLLVAGCSMVPAFWPGDLADITPCDFSSLRAGEIIVFRRRDTLVMHRILSRSGATVTTRGDARRRPDAPVAPEYCIGKVDRVLRNGRPVSVRLSPAQACIAWLLRHSDLATSLYLRCCSILRRLRDLAQGQERAPGVTTVTSEITSELRTQG